MPRPRKWRRVTFTPNVVFFKPAGIPMRELEQVALSLEELEAVRLHDLEGMEQEEAAAEMRVSRPTFHRVLASARKKLAEALVEGKAIRIGGGRFQPAMGRFRCEELGHEWDVPFEELVDARPSQCPECQSAKVLPVGPVADFLAGQSRRRTRQRASASAGETRGGQGESSPTRTQ